MAPFVVRRSERIDYRVPVTLFATRANVAPVIAQSMDVSEGGMRVFAPIPVPVGSTVRCELTLDGRSAMLEGRVAWLARPNDHDDVQDDAIEGLSDRVREVGATGERPVGLGLGIGIRFETLSHEDSGVLRHLVARATEGYMPAELELPGVRTRVAARAVPTASGARISASLPWLRRGALVGVRFVGAPADVHGQITDAVLRELPSGGRRLQIEVEADAPTRARRDTRYGDALDFERAPKHHEHAPTEALERDSRAVAPRGVATHDSPALSFEPPTAASRTWLALTCGALLGSAVTLAATSFAGTATWPIWAKSERVEPNHSPRIETRVPSAPKPLSATSQRAPRTELGSAQESAPLTASSALTQAEQGTTGASAAPVIAPPASAPVASREPVVPEAATVAPSSRVLLPMIEVVGGTSIVRIPFRGELTGMIARVWADPYALAIDLPDGNTSLPLGRYALHDSSAASLRLQERDNLLLLRITLARPIATHSVSASGDVLEVRITPREIAGPRQP